MIKIYGSSDDNFVFKGPNGEDEIGCYECVGEIQIGTLAKNGGAIVVRGEYVEPGVWVIGIRPLDEETPMPEWPIRYTKAGYTPVLHVDCPEDTPYGLIGSLDPEYEEYKRLKAKFEGAIHD